MLCKAKQATKKTDDERKKLLAENRMLKKDLSGGCRTKFRKLISSNPGDPLALEWDKANEETTPGPERGNEAGDLGTVGRTKQSRMCRHRQSNMPIAALLALDRIRCHTWQVQKTRRRA